MRAMARQFIIRLSADGRQASWLDSAGGSGQGALGSFPVPDRAAVAVLVPAEDVLLLPAELPGRSRTRLLQALPYALEESLARDIEQYHFALGRELMPGRYLAGVIEQSNMERWTAALADAGIEAELLMPDVVALPEPAADDHAVVLLEGERALVRIGPAVAYAVSRGELDGFLQLQPGLSRVSFADTTADWTPPRGLEPRALYPAGDMQARLFDAVAGPALNLLQGSYETVGQQAETVLKVWKRAAAVLVLAAALALVARVVDHQRVSQSVEDLSAQASGLLLETFPDTGRIVTGQERVQMEQRLNQMRRARGDLGGEGFLYLLRVAGPAVASTAGVTLESVSFRSGSLLMELRADDLATIESLRQAISQGSGVPVDLESARTLADGANAMLRVGGVSG